MTETDSDSVRVELCFDGGQIMGATVTVKGAELIDERPRRGLFGLEVAFVHPDALLNHG